MSGLSVQHLASLKFAFSRAPELAQRELLAAAEKATALLQHEVQENIPTAATGLTRASVTRDAFSTPAGVLGVVASSQPAAVFLELGTKPHMPPVQALVPWVRAAMGKSGEEAERVAFLVARKIAREGTEPKMPFARALASTQAQIVRIFEAAVDRIEAQLAGGAA